MALARVKEWAAAEILTEPDLEAEFDNIYNNPLTLLFPLTGTGNINNQQPTTLRLENLAATQAAAQIGRAYYQTTQNAIHIDTGTQVRQVPDYFEATMLSQVFS